MKNVKKVLIISFLFTPSKEMGAIRISRFFNNLNKFLWQPYILTSGFASTKEQFIKRVPLPLIDWLKKKKNKKDTETVLSAQKNSKFLSWCGGWLYHLCCWLWVIPALWAGIKIIKKEKISIIYCSAGPFNSALIGYLLKKIIHRPLIVEFRDAWKAKHLEKIILKACDFFITTSPATTDKYLRTYSFLQNKIATIYNSFDDLMINNHNTIPHSPFFTITYAGTLYANRNINELLSAVAELKEYHVHLQIYGRISPDYINEFTAKVEELDLNSYVQVRSAVEMLELITILSASQMLLLVQGFNIPNQDLPIAGKTFDYLATGKPILCLAPKGDNVEMIRKYSNNSFIILKNNANLLKSAIFECYHLWQNKKNIFGTKDIFFQEYHIKNITSQLAAIFNRVVK